MRFHTKASLTKQQQNFQSLLQNNFFTEYWLKLVQKQFLMIHYSYGKIY